MNQLYRHNLIKPALAGIAYLAAAILSSQISFSAGDFPILWLPGGLMLGILVFVPYREWPLYLLFSVVGNAAYSAFFKQPLAFAIIYYLSNCLATAAAAWLLLRLNAPHNNSDAPLWPSPKAWFASPRDTLILTAVIAPFSGLLSAAIQSTVLVSLDPGVSHWAAFRIAWIGRMLGILAVTPFILSWKGYWPTFPKLLAVPERIIEMGLLVLGLVTWAYYVFSGSALFLGRGYLVMPFLIWAALRFGPRGTTLSGMIVAVAAAWGLVWQLDSFVISSNTIAPNTDILGTFLAINLITSYFLTTSLEEGKVTADQLKRSETRYRRLIEYQGEGIGILNRNETFTFSNPAGDQIFGVPESGLVGRSLRDFTSPQSFELILQQTHLRQNGEKRSFEIEINRPDGQKRQLLLTTTPEFDEYGQVNGSFTIFRDITERKQTEQALRESQARFQALFNDSPIPIWEEDFSLIKQRLDQLRQNGVEDFRLYFEENPEELVACERLLRVLNLNKAAAQTCADDGVVGIITQDQLYNALWRGPDDVFREEILAISEGKNEFEAEGPNDMVDGVVRYHHVRWLVSPGFQHNYSRVIVTTIDITERKRAEDRLRYLSTHDVLTGLFNRNFFEAEMERLQQGRLSPVNLMVVDVNEMKATNDTYGHAAGDDLLKRTAQVLRTAYRKEDIIARIGGDEFVVLFTGSLPEKEAITRVRACLEDHNLWTQGRPLSLAIGAASGSCDQSLLDVFKKADQRMYREKLRPRRAKPD